MNISDNRFWLDPSYAPYRDSLPGNIPLGLRTVAGESYLGVLMLRIVTIGSGIFIVLGMGSYIFNSIKNSTSISSDVTVAVFGAGVGIILTLTDFYCITRFTIKCRQWRLLRQQGEARDGEIVTCQSKKAGKYKNDLDVTVAYKFLTAQGIEQIGKQTAQRNDLIGKPLPEHGTRVTVLYVNERIHCLL